MGIWFPLIFHWESNSHQKFSMGIEFLVKFSMLFWWYFNDHGKCIELNRICIEIFQWNSIELSSSPSYFLSNPPLPELRFLQRKMIISNRIEDDKKWLVEGIVGIQHHTFYLHRALVFLISSKNLSSSTRYLLCMVGSITLNLGRFLLKMFSKILWKFSV